MKLKIATAALAAALLAPVGASAFTVFEQDFETLGNGTHAEQLYSNARDKDVSCPGCAYGSGSADGAYWNGNFYDNDKNDNWGVHNGAQNQWASGLASGVTSSGPVSNNAGSLMSGNVLGHRKAAYDANESSRYEIHNIDLAAEWDNIKLSFDFDSWIKAGDGFKVFARGDSGVYDLLNPTSASDMQYNASAGFDGMGSSDMLGVAMFDLTQYASQTIDLRFRFTSNGTSQAEGINIDNIIVTADCANGNTGPGCDGDGGTSIPEPTSLALMMLGATAVYHRRRKHV